MGTRSGGYSAVMPPSPHYCHHTRSHRHGELHKSTEFNHYDLCLGEQSFHSRCFLLVLGLKRSVMVLAKHLSNTLSSGFWALWRAALMMTRGFQDSLDPRINTNTHCASNNKVSRMHRFSEIMLESSHVFTHFGPIPGIIV